MRSTPARALLLLGTGLLTAACSSSSTPWLSDAGVDVETPPDALRTRAAAVTTPLVPGAGTPDAALTAPPHVALALFDDLTVEADLDGVLQPGAATVWSGHVSGWETHEVVLSRVDGFVAGTVRAPEATIRLRPLGEGLVAIDELDPTWPATDLEPVVPLDLPVTPETAGDAPVADGTTPVVDVLVAVSAPAATTLGGKSGAEAVAAALVVQANKGYTDSGLDLTLNLAGVHVSTWDEQSFSFGGALSGLYDTTDGLLDDVSTARETVGADAVSLLVVGDGAACGLGYLMSSPSSSFAAAAYNVVDLRCAGPNLSFAHELGHNMGSHHDRANAGSSTPSYPYSYGYRDADAGFRTVMSYSCESGSCPRINRWSNPDSTYDSVPTGIAKTDPKAAHNVASLALTAPVVSAFRTAVDEPVDPEAAVLVTPVSGAALEDTTVTFSWTDVDADSYQLLIGTSMGDADVARVEAGTSTSSTVSGLPDDGSALFVTLWSEHGDAWLKDSAVYTAYDAPVTPATFTDPNPGTILSSSDVSFAWTDVEADGYALVLGSSEGGTDLGSYMTSGTHVDISGLPTDGRVIWGTLYSSIEGDWHGVKATWRAAGTPGTDGPASLLTPLPGSLLTGRTFTFTWTDSGASRYALTITNEDGELHHGIVDGTSARVELSAAARSGPIQVRLASEITGHWFARTTSYTLD